MGDYDFGYVARPPILIADAVAASAAFPGLIGPLVLDTSAFSWLGFDGAGQLTVPVKPWLSKLHLWDGGMYDNLGVESLFVTTHPRVRSG